MEDYRTIRENGVHEIEIKKSRFICHLRRVKSEEEAQSFIEEIKKEHWKATHNCSAYTIGMKDEIQRAHDDGEPSGTAMAMMPSIPQRNLMASISNSKPHGAILTQSLQPWLSGTLISALR